MNRTYNHYCRWREREKERVGCLQKPLWKEREGDTAQNCEAAPKEHKEVQRGNEKKYPFPLFRNRSRGDLPKGQWTRRKYFISSLQGAFRSLDCAYFLYPKEDLEMGLLNYSAFVTCHFLSPPLRLRSIPDASIVSPPPSFHLGNTHFSRTAPPLPCQARG